MAETLIPQRGTILLHVLFSLTLCLIPNASTTHATHPQPASPVLHPHPHFFLNFPRLSSETLLH